MDEEDEEQEGFLDINNDVFWTFNQELDDWEQANVVGHRRVKAASLDHTKDQAKLTLQKLNMKPTIPSGIRPVTKQVGMIRTMEKESRKEKAVKERKQETAFSPLAIKARKKVPLRLQERGSMERARKARLTSVRKPRKERQPPQRLIVPVSYTHLTLPTILLV